MALILQRHHLIIRFARFVQVKPARRFMSVGDIHPQIATSTNSSTTRDKIAWPFFSFSFSRDVAPGDINLATFLEVM
jgi:hypothetical protein